MKNETASNFRSGFALFLILFENQSQTLLT